MLKKVEILFEISIKHMLRVYLTMIKGSFFILKSVFKKKIKSVFDSDFENCF